MHMHAYAYNHTQTHKEAHTQSISACNAHKCGNAHAHTPHRRCNKPATVNKHAVTIMIRLL